MDNQDVLEDDDALSSISFDARSSISHDNGSLLSMELADIDEVISEINSNAGRVFHRRESSDEAKLRRNKAFTAIKQELADREKQKRKQAKERTKRGKKYPVRDQGVFYVDAQRNMAVTMGERDVKTDVKEKSRRDKYLSSAMVEGDTAESYIAQGQIEMRKMSNKDNALFYLDKAVELCDYDKALVVRSRCHYLFGHYHQSIADAEEALRINVDSVLARGCLGSKLIFN